MHGATVEQMLLLDDVLDALAGDIDGFRILSKNGTFIYINDDDGCLSLEWVFNHMRIAIDIERDAKETGWSLVSDREAWLYGVGGYLTDDHNLMMEMAQRIYSILREQYDNLDSEVIYGEENEN